METQTDSTPQIVTLKDVYNMVVSVNNTVQGLPDIKEDVKDHEARLRALEKWIWRASGMAAIAGAGISQVISQIIERQQ